MKSDFFSMNRRRLLDVLGQGSLIVLTAYAAQQKSGDASHPFIQEANFWYLSGIERAGWLIVIDGIQDKTWLVAPDVDVLHQLFDGSIDYSAAKKISGADEILTQKEGEELLGGLARKHNSVYSLDTPPYAGHVDFVLNPAHGQLQERLKKLFAEVKDCQKELAKLRAIKQPAEIAAIKSAITVSETALVKAKTKIASSKHEYEVEAELAYWYRYQNADHAFEPIVACGKNACTLHYVSNSSVLNRGGFVLIDTGARKGCYSGDITRTYAVGTLKDREIAVHQAVKGALVQTVSLLKPGVSMKEYIEESDKIMKNALVSLGLMKNQKETRSYRRYFPHAISHGLGLDVHESLGGYKEFQPGMVLTVEPGIYIPEEGIGVRIEDDILLTTDGHENLTVGLSTDY